ncbi:MAG: hypothetical protein AAB289_10715, partial [Chloroflexota bacterium]
TTAPWRIAAFATGRETTEANVRVLQFLCVAPGSGITCPTSTSAAGVDVTLTAKAFAAKQLVVQGPLNGAFLLDLGDVFEMDAPAGSFGSDPNLGTITIERSFAAAMGRFVPENNESIDIVVRDSGGRRVTTLRHPIQLKFRTTNAQSKRVAYWDEASNSWAIERDFVAPNSTTLQGEVRHLTKFTLFSVPTARQNNSTGGNSGGGGGGGSPASPAPAAPAGPKTIGALGAVAPPGVTLPAVQPIPPTSQAFDPAEGGSVTSGPVTVTVPPGLSAVTGKAILAAEAGKLTLSVEAADLPSFAPGAIRGSVATQITLKNQDGAIIPVAGKALTVTLRPSPEDLALVGGKFEDLAVIRFDANTKTWEWLPTKFDQAAGTVSANTTALSVFALLLTPAATLVGPAPGTVSFDFAPRLSWNNSVGASQYQLQVIPFNNDGPGINLIRDTESSFQLQAPLMGAYILLPGMTYTWRVRTTSIAVSAGENDAWWSPWASGTFR